MKPVVIGIAGGTGSGKTTIAHAIYDAIGRERIEWIAHDAYYRDVERLSLDERSRLNYDHPDALETELLIEHLDRLVRGETVPIPIYDFTTHRRLAESRLVEARRAVIVEGILVLAEPALRERIEIKIFVDTPPDIRFVRRLLRDTQARGRSVESVVEQYMTSVRPMHEEFVEPSKRHADLIIPEGGQNRVALDAIIARIEKLVGH